MSNTNSINTRLNQKDKDERVYVEQLNSLIETVAQGRDSNFYEDFSQLPLANAYFTSSVLGMSAISHVIEDKAIEAATTHDPQIRFYSAFQKFSRLKPQEDRYRKLAKLNFPIYVFGVADVPLPKDNGLCPVILSKNSYDNISLANFWFVVLHNPKFVSMALLAREATSMRPNNRYADKLVFRDFKGFWTYDNQIINQIVTILDNYVVNATLNS